MLWSLFVADSHIQATLIRNLMSLLKGIKQTLERVQTTLDFGWTSKFVEFCHKLANSTGSSSSSSRRRSSALYRRRHPNSSQHVQFLVCCCMCSVVTKFRFEIQTPLTLPTPDRIQPPAAQTTNKSTERKQNVTSFWRKAAKTERAFHCITIISSVTHYSQILTS